MKLAHGLATYALIVLGVIHIGLAPVFFDQFTMRVMWYVAQGLMGVFVAFLNISCRRAQWSEPGLKVLTHLANLLGLLFAVVYAMVDVSPPSFAAIGLFAVLGGTGLTLARTEAGRP